MPRLIRNFHGEFEFLSNFAECPIFYFGMNFNSTEAAFQAAKTNVLEERLAIQMCDTPGKAKKLGRRVTLRDNWEEIKDDVMLDLLRLKFTKGSQLADRLDATGQAILVEGTTWHDQYWGVCVCSEHKGIGKNILGQLLMQVRAENQGFTPYKITHELRGDWLQGGPFTISERQ